MRQSSLNKSGFYLDFGFSFGTMSRISQGIFIDKIDWTDPKFAPYYLPKLDLNSAQCDALILADTEVSISFTYEL